jgi:hypothetical protein
MAGKDWFANRSNRTTDQAQEAIFRDPRTGKRWAGHGKVYDVWQVIMRKAIRLHGIRYRKP